jgi:hypothetical protein
VQELAREKAKDWLGLSSDYAERMLPQIFRKDDPVLQITLPPETRSEMEDLLKGLPKPVFFGISGWFLLARVNRSTNPPMCGGWYNRNAVVSR